MRAIPFLIFSSMAFAPGYALAHPHIFINAKADIVAGAGSNVAEIRNTWVFDEVFSSSVLLDFDKNGDNALDATELSAVGETVRKSMADYSYYTNLLQNGAKVPVSQPDVIHVSYSGGKITMEFAVKPAKPMPLKGKLIFGIYDETLYTAVDFAEDSDIKTSGKGFESCKRVVVRPDPDQIIAQNQATLTDMFFNDPTGTNRSLLAATRLEVTC